MHDSALDIDLSHANGSIFITVAGELDGESVVQLRAVLDEVQLDRHVVVDMAAVGFMDSSGLNAFIDRAVRIEGTGGSIRIANPSRAVHRVVEITGLTKVLYDPQSW